MPPDNQLLQLLDPSVRADLAPVAVQLCRRQVLHEPGAPALYAHFPVTAVVSLVSTMASGESAEVALIGREGMVGLAGVLGAVEGPMTAIVQIPGDALRISTVALKTARRRVAAVRAVLDLYTEIRLIQVAQTAACNRLHPVEARLARWLLAIDERIDGNRFTLPQELIAQMLGVHRPTVTLSLQRLREARVIAYRGRSMAVTDRRGLERLACECHGLLHREFERLLRRPVLADDAPAPSNRDPLASSDREAALMLETIREIAGRLLLANIREQEAREQAEAASLAKDQLLASVAPGAKGRA